MVDSCTFGGPVGCAILGETSTGAIDVVADGTGRGSVVVVVLELVVVLGGTVVVEVVELCSGRVDVDEVDVVAVDVVLGNSVVVVVEVDEVVVVVVVVGAA